MLDNNISKILEKETNRQLQEHNFIASENFASEEVKQLKIPTK